MRRAINLICIAALMCVFTASPVLAIGLGVYGNYSMGQYHWDFKNSSNTLYKYGYEDFIDRVSTNEEHSCYGGGILLDTAVAKDKLLNYRLGIGYDRNTHYSYTLDLKLNRIIISNTFGFGIIRHDDMRLWLGPQLRFSYNWGKIEFDSIYVDRLLSSIRGPIYGKEKDNIKYGRIDFGIAIGANIQMTGDISLGFEFGPRAFIGYGENRRCADMGYVILPYRKSYTALIKYLYGYETFMNVCIFYRIKDEYKPVANNKIQNDLKKT